MRSLYDWKISINTNSTWRIGNGTVSFNNYIYNTMAGITENDIFNRKQIRECVLTREKAMKLVEKENEPRCESIQWYFGIIEIEFYKTKKIINAAPKLYP